MYHLNSGFGQVYFHGYLLSGVNVRVMSLRKSFLQDFQLGAGERGSNPALLAFFRRDGAVLGVVVHLVWEAWSCNNHYA